MARSGEYDNMKYLILAVSLFAVGESAVKYTPPTGKKIVATWRLTQTVHSLSAF
jgi:hypothetical protein